MATENVTHFHPLLTIFPEMANDAFAEFVADIKANGVRELAWTSNPKPKLVTK